MILGLLLSGAKAAAEPITVTVGGYPFEPFVDAHFGITPGFASLLNSHQQIYRFEFVDIPAQRRYELMQAGKIDALFFEMIRWGWRDYADVVSVTAPILAGREVFVALKEMQNVEATLAAPTEHTMALTLGYHYSFANYNSDQAYLRANFKVIFAEKQRTALKYLMTGRADVALASEIFLHHEYLRNTDLRQKLRIADKSDQTYELPLMIRRGGQINVAIIEGILKSLVACDCLYSFFASHGLEKLLVYPAK